jgi:type IV secretory pathway TrbD component
MNARTTKLATLVFAVQCVLMLATVLFNDSDLQWLPATFGVCFWLVPVAGYIVVLYHAPLFARRSPVLRTVSVTVLSLAGSVVGGIALLLCLPLIGIPIMNH